jgi:hypothetical protein
MSSAENTTQMLIALLDILHIERDCLERHDIDGLEAASACKLSLLENLKTLSATNMQVDSSLAKDLRLACRDIEMRLHLLADMTQRRLSALIGIGGFPPASTYTAKAGMARNCATGNSLRA